MNDTFINNFKDQITGLPDPEIASQGNCLGRLFNDKPKTNRIVESNCKKFMNQKLLYKYQKHFQTDNDDSMVNTSIESFSIKECTLIQKERLEASIFSFQASPVIESECEMLDRQFFQIKITEFILNDQKRVMI